MLFALIQFVVMIVAVVLFTIYCINRPFPPDMD